MLTKQHDIFSVIRIGGVDPECLDPEEIDHAAMRFESALRTLGPEFRVYQYALKRELEPVFPPERQTSDCQSGERNIFGSAPAVLLH